MYLLESPHGGDSNNYTKRIIYKKKKCSKGSVTDALDGPYQVSLQQQFPFYSTIVGNKHCRYNEGPLFLVNTGLLNLIENITFGYEILAF